MRIREAADIPSIEFTLNHPEVLPWINLGVVEKFDGTAMFYATLPIWFEGGGFLLAPTVDPQTFEVHTAFLPKYRGAHALQCARETSDWFFAASDGLSLLTKVPIINRRAAVFATMAGFRTIGKNERFILFRKDILDWVLNDPKLAAYGHKYLDPMVSADEGLDPLAYQILGAYVAMRKAKNMVKAINIFNYCSNFCGFPLMDSHDSGGFTIAKQRFAWSE